ncbi:phosphatidylglycerol lysyltransferase domain-containing protein [Streptococcus uberis]|uniref:phosphatidylglycerol lysyltransferase domain-containing protein n=1 Tax=Streptococcus uberis TaxID=1349 RepID=UPI003D35EBAC
MALLKSNNGTVVAFATVEKSHSENSLSVDLMPYLNEAPKGVMDVLFIHLIHYAKEETISTFNMGMCPLSNVGKNRFSFFNEKLGHLLYQFGSHIYSFDGLRNYKEKCASHWHPIILLTPNNAIFYV